MDICNCTGTVFYGRMRNNKSGSGDNTTLSFKDMLKHGYTAKTVLGQIGCTKDSFGSNPAKGYDKQCFCAKGVEEEEEEADLKIEKCANEWGMCDCDGKVVMGARFTMEEQRRKDIPNSKKKELNFDELM